MTAYVQLVGSASAAQLRGVAGCGGGQESRSKTAGGVRGWAVVADVLRLAREALEVQEARDVQEVREVRRPVRKKHCGAMAGRAVGCAVCFCRLAFAGGHALFTVLSPQKRVGAAREAKIHMKRRPLLDEICEIMDNRIAEFERVF